MSTRRSNSARKSAPRIGWSTSARRNWNWKRREPNCRGINLEPQALVAVHQPLGGGGLSVQLRSDEETQILKLQCPLNNHGLTGHLEGTRDNRQWEGCLTLSLLGYLKTRIRWGGVNLNPPSKSHVLCPNMTNDTSLESSCALLLEYAKKFANLQKFNFLSQNPVI